MTSPRPQTELARALREGDSHRVTPLDAFRAAKRKWLSGERIEIGALAKELGIGRATLFRWIGSREQLLGEILWSVCAQTLTNTEARIQSRGPLRIATILEDMVRAIRESPPMRRFLAEDPEYAVRMGTSKASVVQANMVAEIRRLLEEEVTAGALDAPLPLDTLAFIVVRVCESFIYAEASSGWSLETGDLRLTIQLLLSGQLDEEESGSANRKRVSTGLPKPSVARE